MIVEVTQDVRIRYEAGNYTIERRMVVGEHARTKAGNVGKERWDSIGYYGRLVDAAKALLDRHVNLIAEEARPEGIRDLKDLIEAVEHGERIIARACSNVPKEPAKEPVA